MLAINNTFNTTFDSGFNITSNTTVDPRFQGALSTVVSTTFPVFQGVPGSWADMSDFMDAFTAGYEARDLELLPSKSEATSQYFSNQSGPGSWARTGDFSDGFELGWRFGNGLSIRKRSYKSVSPKPDTKKKTKSKRVYDRYSVHSITLIIKNLPSIPSVVDLKEIFERYGKVSHIKFILKAGECSGIGFVTFKTPQGSARAFNALHKIPYRDGIVYTEYARDR